MYKCVNINYYFVNIICINSTQNSVQRIDHHHYRL